MKNSVAWVSAFSLICAALAYAGVPQTINYQGYLTTAGGAPATGPVSMVFSLYSSNPARNNPVWRETQPTVPLANGIYNTKLGSVSPISAPFDVPYFLGVKVGSDTEMPLQPMSSVGYALRAGVADSLNSKVVTGTPPLTVSSTTVIPNLNADLLDGKHSTDFVAKNGDTMTDRLNLPLDGLTVGTNQMVIAGGNAGIGTASPLFKLDIESVFKTDAKFGDALPIYLVHSLPSIGFNAYYDYDWKLGKGSAGNYGGVLDLDFSGNFRFQTSNMAGNSNAVFTPKELLRIQPNGNVGIGTTTPTATLDVNGNARISGTLTTGSLGANIVTTPAIADNNVTTAKIADGSVTDTKITGPISSTKLNLTGVPANGLVVGTNQLVTNSGLVGIGTNTPKRLLQLSRAGATELSMEVSDGASNNRIWNFAAYGVPTTVPQLDVRILNDSGSAVTKNVLTLKGDGNVGIGTTVPTAVLDVNGNTRVRGGLQVDSTAMVANLNSEMIGGQKLADLDQRYGQAIEARYRYVAPSVPNLPYCDSTTCPPVSVVHITLPPGNFALTFGIWVYNSNSAVLANNTRTVTCWPTGAGPNALDGIDLKFDSGESRTSSWTTTRSGPGQIDIYCLSPYGGTNGTPSGVYLYEAKITAIKVGTITRQDGP